MPNPFRRVSAATTRQHAEDGELGGRYDELRAAADDAVEALRHAASGGAGSEDVRSRRSAAERALLAVIGSAEAARRHEAGLATYGDRIAFRKALARTAVDRWTRRLVDLRTARETLKLSDTTIPGVLLPNSVRIENTAAYGPHQFGLEALPGTLRSGVDVGAVVDR